MRFLFLNQYGPPDPVPTARLLGELAAGLRAGGHEVEIVAQGQTYHGRPASGGRLRRELRAAWTILYAGWRPPGGRPDVVLALSSPPGLPVVGALLAWRHRARLVHWAMDLYPELALALGEIPRGRLVARVVQAAMRWAYRRAALVVALDEDMQAHLQASCPTPVRVLEPWPGRETEQQADDRATHVEPTVPWTWLYSGNLGRAHEWRTLLDAQAILEARGCPVELAFQGDGAARAPAMAHAQTLGLRRCVWKGYAAEAALVSTLLEAQALIVTQRPETRGLLWPSKLALLERLPRPIVFVGPEDGAIARRLRARGGAGVFPPGAADALAQWVATAFEGNLAQSGEPPVKWPTVAARTALLQQWLLDSGR